MAEQQSRSTRVMNETGDQPDSMSVELKESKPRRQQLKRILIGAGAFGLASQLPKQWSKPVVNSVLLPAHAQTSIVTTTTVAPTTTNTTTTSTTTTSTTTTTTTCPPGTEPIDGQCIEPPPPPTTAPPPTTPQPQPTQRP